MGIFYTTDESKEIFKVYPENYDYENKDELRIDEIENGIVHRLEYPNYGCVTDDNYNIIETSITYWSFSPEKSKIMIFNKIKERKYYDYIDEDVVFLGVLKNHWGHFINESLTRLWYFLDENNKNKKACYLYEESGEEFLYFFKWFGLNENQLIKIDKNTKFKKVIVPEVSCVHVNMFHQKYKETLNRIVSKFEPLNYKKIYISRTKFQNHQYGAKTFGEEVIEKIFENNGYKIIYPEDFNDEYMIRLMKGAEYVAGLYGSGLINILFANDNTKLIILFRSLAKASARLTEQMKTLDVQYIDVYLASISSKSTPVEFGQPYLVGITEEFKNFLDENNFVYDLKDASKNILEDTNNYVKSFIYVNSQKYKNNDFYIIENDIKNSINRFSVYEQYNPIIRDYFNLLRKMIFYILDKTTTNNIEDNINYKKMKDFINKIAWWIPIKKWRDNFRNKFTD